MIKTNAFVAASFAGMMMTMLFAQSGTPFGNPDKAEFYPLQTNPHLSDGVFLPGFDSAENFYVIPRVLLRAADIASASVIPASPGSALFNVEMILNGAGRSKVAGLIAQYGPDRPVAVVWRNMVYYTHLASKLDTAGAIVVAEGLDQDGALALRAALQ